MKKILLILTLLLYAISVSATDPPTITVLSPIAPAKIYFNNDLGNINAEITPWSLGTKQLGGWSTFFITTYNTYICTTPSNMFELTSEERLADRGNCKKVIFPSLNSDTYPIANQLPLWKRDYYGVFSAHLINSGASSVVYTINHGESGNNNNNMGEPLPSCAPLPDMGYGSLPCEDRYWWGSYNAYVSLSSFPWNLAALTSGPNVTDYGPIAWPANGYIESLDLGITWIKATDGGIRSPASIIHEGYFYVFFEDTSQGYSSGGRGPGIKLIRAPITKSGIDPLSFRSYYNGTFADSSLPSNFNLPHYYNYFPAKGGRSSSLFQSEPIKLVSPTPGTGRTDQRQIGEVISFSVAKIINTSQFLGVGYDLSKGVTLRLSSDLLNWSEPAIVRGTESNYWSGIDLQKVPLLYPRLSNSNGDTNTQIDPNDFYIIGTQTGMHQGVTAKIVNVIHLKLNTPQVILGDLNSDGKVDNSDLMILSKEFGKTSSFNANADPNKDNKVDIKDFVILAKNMGR